MAQAYRCRQCHQTVNVGVPTVPLTRQVSEALSVEIGRMIVYHDWSPAATDRSLRDRAEQIWQEKCETFFTVSNNLRTLPDACPNCSATYNWDIALATLVLEE